MAKPCEGTQEATDGEHRSHSQFDVTCGADVQHESGFIGAGIGHAVKASAWHRRAGAWFHDPVFPPGSVPNRTGQDLDPFVLTEMQMAGYEAASFETNLGAERSPIGLT